MFRICIVLCLALFAGCQKNQGSEYSKYHEDGRSKPVVAVIPVIDSSSFEMPWSLSDEMTSLIRKKMSSKETLFIPSSEELHSISYSNEPFGTDISWVAQNYEPNEFIVFLELLDHQTVAENAANANQERTSKSINMTARIRVVDIRSKTPKIVLQETLTDSYFVSKNILPINYEIAGWGTDDYTTTPMAMAHIQFAKKIVERINDYVLIAKSR